MFGVVSAELEIRGLPVRVSSPYDDGFCDIRAEAMTKKGWRRITGARFINKYFDDMHIALCRARAGL